ncbi:putative phosphatase, C-terminal domain of histone macro H2A1 like protein [Bernardetia litoralis DSM 6794]|uniref:Putative phosphatase, C-terminal domain of histone macro H2A1 like protein n=1 Tax=Bernardetia litoralis (strain ATCC 23117 / DSM 6794 / NBRC 15988 / NCIMB 1366 / Fx l1 / Sio-4) TaxID=880071 RepID=I4ALY5_BERLS|nr:O-acetyl-ADP-ribose deacetylase [Bernardetia litoralis]AFM04970.1 putative phosphatase, C-terminal domain of histone macro H2A1 like protein [Bernardetia litoralis DSM 6794]
MKTKLLLQKGDITKIAVDAIVNAANTSLLGGGGVDGAIHRAGGKEILEECIQIRNRQGGCKTGDAVYTNAGNLPAKYVIHTVGSVWQDGTHGERELLASCYQNSLQIAQELQIKSISFPNISTGIYKFPKEEAAEIALNTVNKFVKQSKCLDNNSVLEEIIFVCFDDENYKIYERTMEIILK